MLLNALMRNWVAVILFHDLFLGKNLNALCEGVILAAVCHNVFFLFPFPPFALSHPTLRLLTYNFEISSLKHNTHFKRRINAVAVNEFH